MTAEDVLKVERYLEGKVDSPVSERLLEIMNNKPLYAKIGYIQQNINYKILNKILIKGL